MIADFQRRIRRQQGGVLLDTNVLLPHLVHRASPSVALEWNRTSQFIKGHYALLEVAVRSATRLVTTPHILAELTNLAGKIPIAARIAFWRELRAYLEVAREVTVLARRVSRDDDFEHLGLADLAQALLPSRGKPLIVTVDGPLTATLERRRLPHENLNHLVFPQNE